MLLEACPPLDEAATAVVSVEEIFHREVPRLYSLARRLMGNDVDAEDVIGDVLVAVLRKVNTFRGEARLSTWLHRVTVNAALAQRRKRARRREREISPTLAARGDEAAAGWASSTREGPDRLALRNEVLLLVEQAIAGLPELYRDVYVLADVEQLPNAEIGALLGLSVAAIKSRLHRARLLMREALASYS